VVKKTFYLEHKTLTFDKLLKQCNDDLDLFDETRDKMVRDCFNRLIEQGAYEIVYIDDWHDESHAIFVYKHRGSVYVFQSWEFPDHYELTIHGRKTLDLKKAFPDYTIKER